MNGLMLQQNTTILLVEDDVFTAVPLIRGLQDHGFRPLHATDGRQGLEYARAAQPDLVVLDTTLPRMDGFALCRTLRQESVVPIIMLGAGGQGADPIKGLEIGADDYVTKPFSFPELVARMQALLRRCELDRRQVSPTANQIVLGDIVLDRTARQVWRAGRLLDIPRREYELLRILMEKAGQAVSSRELLSRVWGEDWIGDTSTLKVHIYRLRKKLEDNPAAPRYIQTVRGYGYRFVALRTQNVF